MRQDDRRSRSSSRAAETEFDESATLLQQSVDVTLRELLDVPSVLYEVLAAQKRRAVLQYLVEYDDPASVDDVTNYVAAVKHDTLPEAVTPGLRNEVRTRLVHLHLPKLSGFGLIEWHRGRDEVELQRDSELLQMFEDGE